jgi:hypothetical protein
VRWGEVTAWFLIDAKLTLPETALGETPHAAPPKQKGRGGSKPKLKPEEIERGREIYHNERDKYPPEHPLVAALRVKDLLKLGFEVDWKTIDRWIIRPKSQLPKLPE